MNDFSSKAAKTFGVIEYYISKLYLSNGRGIFDTFPVSLITTQSIARLGEMVGGSLDVQRFRPNILVQTCDETPFAEDSGVGCVLRIGGLTMRVDKRDGRCAAITIDPTTTERNPEILRAGRAKKIDSPESCRSSRLLGGREWEFAGDHHRHGHRSAGPEFYKQPLGY